MACTYRPSKEMAFGIDMTGSCARCIKLVLIAFNIIFGTLGVVNVYWGILLWDKTGGHITGVYGLPFFKFVGGCSVVFGATLGLTGAWKRSPWFLTAYAITLGILLFVEIFSIILTFVARTMVSTRQKQAYETMQKYYTDESSRNWWDAHQERFQCCGINSAKDWQFIQGSPNEPPWSCGEAPFIRPGCWELIKKYAEERFLYSEMIDVAVLLLDLLCIVFASCLASKCRDECVHQEDNSGTVEAGTSSSST